MGDKEAGIARSRAKETNNQQDAGARGSGTGTKKIKLSRQVKSNPRSGGGINRSLRGF